ncbi:hypothetical protein EGW08_022994 [Elysia chlorotica]|uniref:Uncharacterized protein n=1 Tax=Elysia chlorotica TaxID=188477 RepID=A0A433SJI1_ELYCH|nr:hypothetical protein EGW08_022994 [Elysia chlorotica]
MRILEITSKAAILRTGKPFDGMPLICFMHFGLIDSQENSYSTTSQHNTKQSSIITDLLSFIIKIDGMPLFCFMHFGLIDSQENSYSTTSQHNTKQSSIITDLLSYIIKMQNAFTFNLQKYYYQVIKSICFSRNSDEQQI